MGRMALRTRRRVRGATAGSLGAGGNRTGSAATTGNRIGNSATTSGVAGTLAAGASAGVPLHSTGLYGNACTTVPARVASVPGVRLWVRIPKSLLWAALRLRKVAGVDRNRRSAASVQMQLAGIDHDDQGHRVRANDQASMAIRQLSHRSMIYRGVGFAPGMNAVGRRNGTGMGGRGGEALEMVGAGSVVGAGR